MQPTNHGRGKGSRQILFRPRGNIKMMKQAIVSVPDFQACALLVGCYPRVSPIDLAARLPPRDVVIIGSRLHRLPRGIPDAGQDWILSFLTREAARFPACIHRNGGQISTV